MKLETKKRKFSTFVLFLPLIVVGLITSFLIGTAFGEEKWPDNCAELGVAHLDIGKKNLNITDFGSNEWDKLIDDETELVNFCYRTTGGG